MVHDSDSDYLNTIRRVMEDALAGMKTDPMDFER